MDIFCLLKKSLKRVEKDEKKDSFSYLFIFV